MTKKMYAYAFGAALAVMLAPLGVASADNTDTEFASYLQSHGINLGSASHAADLAPSEERRALDERVLDESFFVLYGDSFLPVEFDRFDSVGRGRHAGQLRNRIESAALQRLAILLCVLS